MQRAIQKCFLAFEFCSVLTLSSLANMEPVWWSIASIIVCAIAAFVALIALFHAAYRPRT